MAVVGANIETSHQSPSLRCRNSQTPPGSNGGWLRVTDICRLNFGRDWSLTLIGNSPFYLHPLHWGLGFGFGSAEMVEGSIVGCWLRDESRSHHR